MHIQVRVLRSTLPYGLAIFIRDLPGLVLYYIDSSLISPAGAKLLEHSMNCYVGYWDRVREPEPVPTLIKVAG